MRKWLKKVSGSSGATSSSTDVELSESITKTEYETSVRQAASAIKAHITPSGWFEEDQRTQLVKQYLTEDHTADEMPHSGVTISLKVPFRDDMREWSEIIGQRYDPCETACLRSAIYTLWTHTYGEDTVLDMPEEVRYAGSLQNYLRQSETETFFGRRILDEDRWVLSQKQVSGMTPEEFQRAATITVEDFNSIADCFSATGNTEMEKLARDCSQVLEKQVGQEGRPMLEKAREAFNELRNHTNGVSTMSEVKRGKQPVPRDTFM
jgi:hypothetical protein